MSPLTVHLQFSDTISTLFWTPIPLSLCFDLFSLQKETTGLAPVQPPSAVPLAQSSWKRNSWKHKGVPAPPATVLGKHPKAGTRQLLGSKKSPSGNWTVINKSCSWMVYLVPGSIPERGDWKYSIQPVRPPSLGTLPGLPATRGFMDLAHNVD